MTCRLKYNFIFEPDLLSLDYFMQAKWFALSRFCPIFAKDSENANMIEEEYTEVPLDEDEKNMYVKRIIQNRGTTLKSGIFLSFLVIVAFVVGIRLGQKWIVEGEPRSGRRPAKTGLRPQQAFFPESKSLHVFDSILAV